MSNYTKATDFAAKDNLFSGNPSKAIVGSEIDDEFNSLQTSSATKADKISGGSTNDLTSQDVNGNVQSSGISTDGSGNITSTIDFTGTVDLQGTWQIGSTSVTATAAELNTLVGITSTVTELNLLTGVTATTAELNYVDVTAAGTAQASKAVVLDGSKNIASLGTVGCGAITSTGNLSINKTTPVIQCVTSGATDTGLFRVLNTGDDSGLKLQLNADESIGLYRTDGAGANVQAIMTTGTADQNVTFAGTINSGAITSTGAITGASLVADNLTVNGNTISAGTGAVNITPAAGSAIVLDGTISVDAGVVTGATSITSTDFVGDLTGNVTGNVTGDVVGHCSDSWVLIDTDSVSAGTTATLEGMSSTYDEYEVVFYNVSRQTTANTFYCRPILSSTPIGTEDTIATIPATGTDVAQGRFRVWNPDAATEKFSVVEAGITSAGTVFTDAYLNWALSTAMDGFNFYTTSSGPFTGEFRLYGRKK